MTGVLHLLRRWIGLLILATLVAAGCVVLSQWQWHRREARLAAIAVVEANYNRAPTPLADVLPTNDPLPGDAVWTPVLLHGRYVPSATTLVRNRPLHSAAGFSVLVPFLSDDGRVLLVNRGFVPTGETGGRPSRVPAPPSGSLTLQARLLAPESTTDQVPPPGQTYRINPEALAVDLADRSDSAFVATQVVTGGYGLVASEQPSAVEAPVPLPKPDLDEGPHLSYSIQWIIFAVGALGGVTLVIRRTLQDERAEAALAAGAPLTPKPRRRPDRVSDEAEEDALLDAVEARQRPS